jgi:hypothetical protein
MMVLIMSKLPVTINEDGDTVSHRSIGIEPQNGVWHLNVNGQRVSTHPNEASARVAAKVAGHQQMREVLIEMGLDPDGPTP